MTVPVNKSSSDLTDFLISRISLIKETAVWDTIHLEVTTYLGNERPPIQYITSVRAIVFQGDKVLVVRDQDDHYHIVPGGRREADERLEETLQREILEETGWMVKDVHPFGFVHFRHLTPCPPDYAYPYPDFIQLLYVAAAERWVNDSQITDEYVTGSQFVNMDEVRKLNLDQSQYLLLEAAERLQLHQRPTSPSATGKPSSHNTNRPKPSVW